jgi:hypothetical protein
MFLGDFYCMRVICWLQECRERLLMTRVLQEDCLMRRKRKAVDAAQIF